MNKTLTIILLCLLFVGWITYQMMQLATTHCSLCVSFGGRQQCSEAKGPSEKDALEEAHRNACALLASGVTESVNCTNAPSEQIKCDPIK